jgi:hypothetical protein
VQPCAPVLAVTGVRRRGVVLREPGPICGGRGPVGLGIRPVQGGGPSRFQCRTVVLFDVVQEGVQTSSVVACRGGRVTCVGLIVTLIGVVQDVQRSLSAGGLSRIPGVGSDLTCVQLSFPLIRRVLSPVTVTDLLDPLPEDVTADRLASSGLSTMLTDRHR